jgi:cobalt transporter subunit CbtA
VFGRIFITALAAGFIAGLFIWGEHMVKAVPLILEAEVYEVAAQGAATQDSPDEGYERHAYTLITDLITAIGFALMLAAAFALSGRDVDWREGLLWGLGGYAAFTLAPSLGLPPEVPGMQAADLGQRQAWWLATVVATLIGMGLIFFARAVPAKALGGVLIVLPHLIGAPAHEAVSGPLPAELAAEFVAVSLITTGLFWLVLGGSAGFVYRRLGQARAEPG